MRQWFASVKWGMNYALTFATVVCFVISASQSALPSDRAAVATGLKAYHLPAQPLSSALEIFAKMSNRELLYDGGLSENRRSADVDGVYPPEMALDILLSGTGLQANVKDGGFFAITPAEPTQSDARPSDAGAERHYYGLIQAALRNALCGIPSEQRIAARLWVGRTGEVLQARSLGVSPDGSGRIVDLLRGIRIGVPPRNFAQPITIVVQAGPSAQTHDCVGPLETARGGLP